MTEVTVDNTENSLELIRETVDDTILNVTITSVNHNETAMHNINDEMLNMTNLYISKIP